MASAKELHTTLETLLEEIAFRRRKDLFGGQQCPGSRLGDESVASATNTTYWTDLFVRHFLFQQTNSDGDGDDLLFFIRKNTPCSMTSSATALKNDSVALEVFRRDSRKLPIGDPDIDWEETIYLNLVIHQLNYTVTLAVCSRTSPKNLQVLRRYSQKVYATPSRRRSMESKSDNEEMTYPYISFAVDNFADMFDDVVVRDGESVGIELTATDPENKLINAVLFSASVPYEAIHRVYEARTSQTVRKRLSQTNLFSLFSGSASGVKYGESRVEFVRLVGPQGHAELAISKVNHHRGCETPASEPATDMLDQFLGESDLESDCEDNNFINPSNHSLPPPSHFRRSHQRRLSDPSSMLNDFMRLGVLDRPGRSSRALAEMSEHWDAFGDASVEIYAGDLLDEFEETKYNPLWTMRGHTQIFHFWRESKRLQCVPLGQYVTYVALPWWAIINDILDSEPHRPLLTF